MKTLKSFGSEIQNVIAGLINDGAETNFEILKKITAIKKYKSVQLEMVDSKLNKMAVIGIVEINNTVISNHPTKEGMSANQIKVSLTDKAFDENVQKQ